MNEEMKYEFLKDEYLTLQNIVDSFDAKSLTIKAWSVTLATTGIIAELAVNQPFILILIGISAFLFLIIEVIWKTFQYAHYDRLGKIERYFSGDIKRIEVLQISSNWYKHYKKGELRRFFRIMKRSNVNLPHSIIIILSIILFFLNYLF